MALSTRDALNMTPDDYVEMLQNLGMWDLQKPHTHRGYIYMSKRDPKKIRKKLFADIYNRCLGFYQSPEKYYADEKKNLVSELDLGQAFGITLRANKRVPLCICLTTIQRTYYFRGENDQLTHAWFAIMTRFTFSTVLQFIGPPRPTIDFLAEAVWDVKVIKRSKTMYPEAVNLCSLVPNAAEKKRLCFYDESVVICDLNTEPGNDYKKTPTEKQYRKTSDCIVFRRYSIMCYGTKGKEFYFVIGECKGKKCLEVVMETDSTHTAEEIKKYVEGRTQQMIAEIKCPRRRVRIPFYDENLPSEPEQEQRMTLPYVHMSPEEPTKNDILTMKDLDPLPEFLGGAPEYLRETGEDSGVSSEEDPIPEMIPEKESEINPEDVVDERRFEKERLPVIPEGEEQKETESEEEPAPKIVMKERNDLVTPSTSSSSENSHSTICALKTPKILYGLKQKSEVKVTPKKRERISSFASVSRPQKAAMVEVVHYKEVGFKKDFFGQWSKSMHDLSIVATEPKLKSATSLRALDSESMLRIKGDMKSWLRHTKYYQNKMKRRKLRKIQSPGSSESHLKTPPPSSSRHLSFSSQSTQRSSHSKNKMTKSLSHHESIHHDDDFHCEMPSRTNSMDSQRSFKSSKFGNSGKHLIPLSFHHDEDDDIPHFSKRYVKHNKENENQPVPTTPFVAQDQDHKDIESMVNEKRRMYLMKQTGFFSHHRRVQPYYPPISEETNYASAPVNY